MAWGVLEKEGGGIMLEFPQNCSVDVGFRIDTDSDKCVDISIIDDYYGDSQTGMGASLVYELNREQVTTIVGYLLKWLAR
jgi:hypothetical protein